VPGAVTKNGKPLAVPLSGPLLGAGSQVDVRKVYHQGPLSDYPLLL